MISGIFSGLRAVVALFVSTGSTTAALDLASGTRAVVELVLFTGFTTAALDLAAGTRAVVALVVVTGFTTAAFDLASGMFGKNGAGCAICTLGKDGAEISETFKSVV